MPEPTPAAVRKQIEVAARADPSISSRAKTRSRSRRSAHEFAELVEEGLRAFNVERIHAGDLTTGDRLADGVARLDRRRRTLPMMAPRRVVIVLQAETLLVPKRESEAATRALDAARGAAQAARAADDARARGGADRQAQPDVQAAAEAGDDRRVRRASRIRPTPSAGSGRASPRPAREIEPAAARLLAERAGTDVKRLRNDVDRLLLYALGQKTITLDDVREIAGPAALQDDWAMTNAIEAGQAAEALRQLALMLDAGAPPEKILGQLGWLVRTKFPALAPGGVRPAVDAVFRTDLDLKRSAGDPRVLLERLVVELCAGKRAAALTGRQWRLEGCLAGARAGLRLPSGRRCGEAVVSRDL